MGVCVTDTLREHGYLTSQDIAKELAALTGRIVELERQSRRMKLAKADLLRLQAGDVLAIRVPRPLASDERQQLATGFRQLFASIGHADDIQAAIICGHDAVELDVIRPEANNGTDL
jgi:uncharacterized protein YbjT (DUF2867 family)